MKREQHQKTSTIFDFKQKSFDFIVEEKLPFKLTGKGDALFVLFEKQNKTTMDVINFLCKEFHISRMTLGVAWLKDKDAITRQWISIYKSALDKMWWERVFIHTLSRITRVLEAEWHTRPLQMTDPITNHFSIRLRATQHLSQAIKQEAKEIVQQLFTEWFPNFFGTQRFGINGKNRELWKDIVNKKTSFREPFEAKFKLQAYASWLFNQYLKERLPLGKQALEWEIIKNGEITWPVWWDDILLADPKSKAGIFQQEFMKKNQIDTNFFTVFKKYKLFWIPRALWVMPKDTRIRFQEDDILLDFSLPSWAYASILIYLLLEKLWKISY